MTERLAAVIDGAGIVPDDATQIVPVLIAAPACGDGRHYDPARQSQLPGGRAHGVSKQR
jgi:hypothetical protein